MPETYKLASASKAIGKTISESSLVNGYVSCFHPLNLIPNSRASTGVKIAFGVIEGQASLGFSASARQSVCRSHVKHRSRSSGEQIVQAGAG